jgi:ribokinase
LCEVIVCGAINLDINLFISRFPDVGEEVEVKRLTRIPGGKGANVAVATSRILGKDKVAIFGGLGNDVIGREQIETLAGEGVKTSALKTVEGVESGQAYITIDGRGQNMIHTLFGANLEFTPADIMEESRRILVENSMIVIVIDPRPDSLLSLARLGDSLEKTVIFDPGVRSTLGLSELGDILRSVDYVVLNSVEIENMTGKKDPIEAFKKLKSQDLVCNLIAKCGADGCVMVGSESDEIFSIAGVDLHNLGLQVVNTVGAGDAFLGVFAAFKSLGFSDYDCLVKANAAGAFKVTQPVTRGSPTRKELEAFMSKIGVKNSEVYPRS